MNKQYYTLLNENDEIIAEKVLPSPQFSELPIGWKYVLWQEPIDFIKQRKIQQVKTIRDAKLVKGGYKVADKWFHSDTFSRSQQLGLTIVGVGLPNNIDWKTMDGTKVRLTPQLVQQLFSAAVAQDSNLFAYGEYLINLISSSSNPDEVDIDSGWPETYKGI